jgi:PHD/YefM family antitoxin component YafN of YafNO toxin-antitoxin module
MPLSAENPPNIVVIDEDEFKRKVAELMLNKYRPEEKR